MDILTGILEKYDVVLYVLSVLAVLQGIAKALEVIKDKTSTQVDNKVAAVLNKVIGAAQWCLDLVSGNLAHK
jgi:hypothetical protein